LKGLLIKHPLAGPVLDREMVIDFEVRGCHQSKKLVKFCTKNWISQWDGRQVDYKAIYSDCIVTYCYNLDFQQIEESPR